MKRPFLTLAVCALLVLPMASLAEDAEDGAVLSLGDENDTVQQMQTDLARLGYYEGTISGRFGEQTLAAVRAFQADFGLDQDGTMDEADLQTLSEAPYRPLAYGSSGEDVKRLQTRLTVLGYYKGKISGNYLDSTEEAVRAFQEKMGQLETGDADIGTQTLLYGDDARTAKQSAVKSKATATPETEVL